MTKQNYLSCLTNKLHHPIYQNINSIYNCDLQQCNTKSIHVQPSHATLHKVVFNGYKQDHFILEYNNGD